MESMRPTIDTAALSEARPSTAEPMQYGGDVLSDLLGRSPDECPELLRSMAMTRGTLDTAAALLAELEHRLSHVLTPSEPYPIDSVAPVVRTAAGGYADGMYGDACRVERRVRDLLARLVGV